MNKVFNPEETLEKCKLVCDRLQHITIDREGALRFGAAIGAAGLKVTPPEAQQRATAESCDKAKEIGLILSMNSQVSRRLCSLIHKNNLGCILLLSVY